jgi:hypothetical protein
VPLEIPHPASTVEGAACAFELWLSGEFHRLFSAVAAEPIPPQLLRLIDCLAEEAAGEAAGPPSSGERGTIRAPGFDQRVRERAYFLWLSEGCPGCRTAEHWRLASVIQATDECAACGC